MVTYATLETYLNKCKAELEGVNTLLEATKKDLALYENSSISIRAQIMTLEQLMDTENNKPIVELPYAEDEIEKMFKARLDGPKELSPEEVHKDRQTNSYLREAMSAVKDIDAINREELSAGENTEVDS